MNTNLCRTLTLGASLAVSLALADESNPPPQPAPPSPPAQGPETAPNSPSRRNEQSRHNWQKREPGVRRTGEMKPFLGVVTMEPSDPLRSQLSLAEGEGLVVEAVSPRSPAEKAGILRNDVLRLFNDQILSNPAQLAMLVHRAGKGTSVNLRLLRKGHEENVTAVLDEREAMPDFSPFPPRSMQPGAPGFPAAPGVPRLHIDPEPKNLLNGYMDQLRAVDGQMGKVTQNLQEFRKQIQERVDEARRRASEAVKQWETGGGSMPEIKVDVSGAGKNGGVSVQVGPSGSGAGPSVSISSSSAGAQPGASIFYSTGAKNASSSSNSLFLSDGSGSYTLATKDGASTFTAKDKDGKVLFAGPVNSEDQRKALPENLRERLSHMENRAKSAHGEPNAKPKPADQEGEHPKDGLEPL